MPRGTSLSFYILPGPGYANMIDSEGLAAQVGLYLHCLDNRARGGMKHTCVYYLDSVCCSCTIYER